MFENDFNNESVQIEVVTKLKNECILKWPILPQKAN